MGNGGEAGWGTWTQTLGDVELRVAVPYGTTAKACDVQVRKASIKVGLKGAPPLVEGPLFAEARLGMCVAGRRWRQGLRGGRERALRR